MNQIKKTYTTKQKIDFLKKKIQDNSLKDIDILYNILYLIKKLPKNLKNFFKDETVIYNDINELVDIKLALKETLDELKKELIIIHFRIQKSYGILNEERSEHLDNLYYLIYPYILPVEWTIMLQQVNNLKINIEELQTVKNANRLVWKQKKYEKKYETFFDKNIYKKIWEKIWRK